jgi:hypothetical protein
LGVAPAFLRGQNLNSRINVACIGVGGKGGSDTDSAFNLGGNIVALCDVDENTLKGKNTSLIDRAPRPAALDAKLYRDFRKLLRRWTVDRRRDRLDARSCSWVGSDHGDEDGQTCLLPKPLTQTVWEARETRRLAKEKAGHADGQPGSGENGLRRAVEVIRRRYRRPARTARLSNRPVWPQD